MAETKYIEENGYTADLPAGERTLDKASVRRIPVEMSKEESEEEARQAEIAELLGKTVRSNAENTRLIDLLAAHQGFNVPETKLNKRT